MRRILLITSVLLSALCASARTSYTVHSQNCGSNSTLALYCPNVAISDSNGSAGTFWIDTGYKSPFGFVLFTGIDNGATVQVTAVLEDQTATFTQGTHVLTDAPTIITVSFPGGFLTAHLSYRYNDVGRAPGWLVTYTEGAVTFY